MFRHNHKLGQTDVAGSIISQTIMEARVLFRETDLILGYLWGRHQQLIQILAK